ncbi:hypothetical protein E2C01_044830 [Portunus trituberculatus]|uniref:Uncharacterized protein n=1 Tax=Portunus trituberculatus TaxID=210409 RepID=A0A5B7G3E2_PORTR|nr:hypothetical protein [Portunus trituberculatus]
MESPFAPDFPHSVAFESRCLPALPPQQSDGERRWTCGQGVEGVEGGLLVEYSCRPAKGHGSSDTTTTTTATATDKTKQITLLLGAKSEHYTDTPEVSQL